MNRKKLNKSNLQISRPRGRPKKKVEYRYIETKMDFIKKVEELSVTGNLAENWRIFWQNFQIFSVAVELEKKKEPVKVAIFLNAIGAEAIEIYNSLNLNEEERNNYNAVTKAFENFCKPKGNEVYESFIFHNRFQASGESFDNFLMELKKLVRRCNFADEDRMVRDRIVLGTNDKKLQKLLLDGSNLTLEKAIDMARAVEVSNQQMAQMGGSESTIDAVGKNNRFENKKYNNFRNKNVAEYDNYSKIKNIECTFCNRKHVKGKCPAYGKICSNCKKKNHFAVVCKKKTIGELQVQSNSLNLSDLCIESIENGNAHDMWYENMLINGISIEFKLDTGAMVNILPIKFIKKFRNVKIEKSNDNLIAYNGTTIRNFGIVRLRCELRKQQKFIKFYVGSDETNPTPILGLYSCVELGLVKRVNHITMRTKEDLLSKYSTLFKGLGCFKENFSIELKAGAQPFSKPSSRIPLSLRDPLKNELAKLCENKIIEKCEKPSEWISNIVIVEKSDKTLRICINPKYLNMAIKDSFYEIPTFNDIKTKLIKKKIFSVLDLKNGFWQIALDEKSRDLCTFSTPFGCYRFNRLPFGIKIAPETFQKFNEENFGDIKNVIVYIDDILIAAETEQEHDETIEIVMKRAYERNVRFNWEKLQWKKSEVSFLGHVISEKGIDCDKKRLKGIEDIGPPKCKKDLQRLMGFINYLREYIPNLAELVSPLRELMKKSVVFEWLPVHNKCLEEIKNKILNAPALKPFDSKEKIVLQTDASQNGIGCALVQNRRPVCFASRSLTDAESRYAQIEKEMLAVVFACQKYHNYIYGRKVEVITDHKPLLGIMKKDYMKIPSAKLQRMKLKLEKYHLTFTYLPGKYLYLADWLSRSYSENIEKEDHIDGIDELVHTVNISEEKKKMFKKETANDEDLKTILDYCKNGWPKDKVKLTNNVKLLWKYRSNLSIEDDLVFFEDRIFVPSQLRTMVLSYLHKSHLGIEKTQKRAKQLLFWPGMNQDIELLIAKCRICQKHRSANTKEPLINHEIPEEPFSKIAMDVMAVEGKDFLVVCDYFSKYLEIIPLVKKTANAIISKLEIVFATHGYPLEIVADNVPFGSFEFRQWANSLDIKITTTSPRYPKSNGFSERMVQVSKKLIEKCIEEKSNFYHALLEYRNSPIKNSQYTPTQLLMGRQTRTMVPGKRKFYKIKDISEKVLPILQRNNENNKIYHDKNAKIKDEFEKGENIWVKVDKYWVPGKILEKHETPRSYIIEQDGKVYRRNSIFLRKRK